MTRAAGVRRSRTRLRVLATGVLASVAALGLGAPAATADPGAAPYPPTAPCALSWAPASASNAEPVLVGSGLGSDQAVDVMLYPQSTTLGSFATDASGGFSAPVDLTGASASSWLTASSSSASCSTTAPATSGHTARPPAGSPGDGPGGTGTGSGAGGSVGSTGGGTGSTPGDTTAGDTTAGTAPTAGAAGTQPGSGVDATSIVAAPASGATGAGAPAAGTRSDYPPVPYPPTQTPAPSTRTATSGAPTAAPSSSSPGTPGRPSHSTPPQSISSNNLSVPLSIILGLAVLLVVAGGMAVLVLTRRSG